MRGRRATRGQGVSRTTPHTRACAAKAGLVEAFARLVQTPKQARLRVAGYLSPQDRPYFDKVVASLKNQGLEQHFEYVGEVTRAQKLAFLRSLHLLSVPTVVQESKGLYVLEAMACGVPVVQPRHGSFPELIEATGGGLLYDTDRPDALTEALARLMKDSALRKSLADRGAPIGPRSLYG